MPCSECHWQRSTLARRRCIVLVVIPSIDASGSASLPRSATYWMPKRQEIDEEGIGYFRDVWAILDVSAREARSIVHEERRLVAAIDHLAVTADDFDRLAAIAECGLDEDSDLTVAERAVLEDLLGDDEPSDLGGLELGVAGLVHALASVRILPAASCRGHVGSRAWSDTPVVFFATTRFRATALQPLVEQCGCWFDVDQNRADLLLVSGSSILATMRLADSLLAARQTFVQPRRSGLSRVRRASQEPLF